MAAIPANLRNQLAYGIVPEHEDLVVRDRTYKERNRIGYLFRKLMNRDGAHVEYRLERPNIVNYPIPENIPVSASNRFEALHDHIDDVYIEDTLKQDPELVPAVDDKANNVTVNVNGNNIKLSWKKFCEVKEQAMASKVAKTIDDNALRTHLICAGFSISDIDDCLAIDRFNPYEDLHGKFDIGVNTEDHNNESTQSKLLDMKQFKFAVKEKVKEVAQKLKSVEAYPKLVYHLKMKYFMSNRNINLVNNMVRDARIYMLNNKFECDNEEDHYIMTQSVMAAFVVDEQELKFKEILKNKNNFNNSFNLSEVLDGKIKTNILSPLHVEQLKRDMRGAFQTEIALPSNKLSI